MFFKTGTVEKILGIFKSGKKEEASSNAIVCDKCGQVVELNVKMAKIKCLCGNEIILPKEIQN